MHKLNGIIAGITIRGLTSPARLELGELRDVSLRILFAQSIVMPPKLTNGCLQSAVLQSAHNTSGHDNDSCTLEIYVRDIGQALSHCRIVALSHAWQGTVTLASTKIHGHATDMNVHPTNNRPRSRPKRDSSAVCFEICSREFSRCLAPVKQQPFEVQGSGSP